MNFTKLTKSEWEFIEKPCTDSEKEVLSFIQKCGVHDSNYSQSSNTYLRDHLKLNIDNEIVDVIGYDYILKSNIDNLNEKFQTVSGYSTKFQSTKKKYNIKKADKIRIENSTKSVSLDNTFIVEMVFLNIITDFLKNILKVQKYDKCNDGKNDKNYKKYKKYATYSAIYVLEYTKHYKNMNSVLLSWFDSCIWCKIQEYYDLTKVLKAYKNDSRKFDCLGNNVMKLYSHQKQVIDIFKSNDDSNNLVFYRAATGLGKTVTPIGIINNKKMIFICIAKHIGMNVAKQMITMGRKVAFAFGCNDETDIRLHNNSVSKYFTEKKHNKEFKRPLHSVGDKVEIMVCDLQSYEHAMNYMIRFTENIHNLVLFWDEPMMGINESSEYNVHIKHVWSCNRIPNIIMSCATLPEKVTSMNIVDDFNHKFGKNSFIWDVQNQYDNIKLTTQIQDEVGYTLMPHTYFDDFKIFSKAISTIKNDIQLLKYLDEMYCIDFIYAFTKVCNDRDMHIFECFDKNKINKPLIKQLYVDVCLKITENDYTSIKNYLREDEIVINMNKFDTIDIIAKNSLSITNGPCLFFTEDYNKLIHFFTKKSKITKDNVDVIIKNIQYNDSVLDLLEQKRKQHEDLTQKEINKEKKASEESKDERVKRLENEIKSIFSSLRKIDIPKEYIPNSKSHLERNNHNTESIQNSDSKLWSRYITERDISSVMSLDTIDNNVKISFLFGIGVLHESLCPKYTTIVKDCMKQNKLYCVIANSDFIYGTDYTFHHMFLCKDIPIQHHSMIQALGRVGRQYSGHNYTCRLRDKNMYENIFFRNANDDALINSFNNIFSS